jgi:uncharacterized protein YwgA/O-acetyl-ADP-ribose deacetylase (regulator of RNase III)
MIKVLIGDVFESKAQTIVNTINCVGVMGKGVALEFKKRFPDMFDDYVTRCNANLVKLGQPYLYRKLLTPWIINFPTKDHWRSVANIHDIIHGLSYLEEHYKEWEISSLAVPPLGCGQGQLEWKVVGPTLYRYLSRLDIPVELYAPFGTSTVEMDVNFLCKNPELAIAGSGQGRIRPEWIALVEILARIEKEPYHWPIGRTIFQKIAYFATEKGIQTGLKYSKGSFGPYSSELKTKTTQLVNNGLICEERLGKMFAVKVGPTFKDAREVYGLDMLNMDKTINLVYDLFLRMSTNSAELAATVHYASVILSKENGVKPSEIEVLAYVMDWKQKRKPPYNKEAVAKTIRNLAVLRLIDVEASSDLPLPETAEIY